MCACVYCYAGSVCSSFDERFLYLYQITYPCRYIEFYDVMSVPMAIALSGQLIRGQPVMVKPSEAEKNLVQSTSTTAAGLTASGAARRLYVGNLVPNITEDQLRVVRKCSFYIRCSQLKFLVLVVHRVVWM